MSITPEATPHSPESQGPLYERPRQNDIPVSELPTQEMDSNAGGRVTLGAGEALPMLDRPFTDIAAAAAAGEISAPPDITPPGGSWPEPTR